MIDEARQAGAFVKHKINRICESASEGAVRATLARLRRGIGKAPGSIPEIWDVTLNGLPEGLVGTADRPSFGEWAVHTALTLYALHQQGKDLKSQCMSVGGSSLGISVRCLVTEEDDEKRVSRRLMAMATSDTIGELSHHLRGLVQLLKAKDLPLDYPELTQDLYRFQFSEARDSVRLCWGREFYQVKDVEQEKNTVEERKAETHENK